jgi:hypothetical protein
LITIEHYGKKAATPKHQKQILTSIIGDLSAD